VSRKERLNLDSHKQRRFSKLRERLAIEDSGIYPKRRGKEREIAGIGIPGQKVGKKKEQKAPRCCRKRSWPEQGNIKKSHRTVGAVRFGKAGLEGYHLSGKNPHHHSRRVRHSI